MEILQRNKIARSGFEGVREYRLVVDDRVADGQGSGDAWQGMGNFVYLADARLVPHGETRLHSHHDIDVISVMLEGRLRHEGSMEHGKSLAAYDVQVQRAGGEGFSHNEINPGDTENRMIQLWVLPERKGEATGYQLFQPVHGGVTRVYGGPAGQSTTFPAQTCIDIARLKGGQSLDVDKAAMVYVCKGRGFANEGDAGEGDLLRVDQLTFDATEDACLIIIHQ
jgi:redox-sensitive bicupin YhaK (pirin superfamily)